MRAFLKGNYDCPTSFWSLIFFSLFCDISLIVFSFCCHSLLLFCFIADKANIFLRFDAKRDFLVPYYQFLDLSTSYHLIPSLTGLISFMLAITLGLLITPVELGSRMTFLLVLFIPLWFFLFYI